MYNVSYDYLDAFLANKARQITGSVICETDSGNLAIEPSGSLIKFTIEKTSPKGKLFGFAVSQKITIEVLGILDTIKKGNKLIPSIGSKDYPDENVLLPYFYVDTVEFNKVKNTTTIIGYDILHQLDSISISSFTFDYPVYALNYALDILEPVGGYVEFEGINQLITEAPNLNGNESARSVLAALAEFTGSICYASSENAIKFRAIKGEEFVETLTVDNYFDLTIGAITTLTKVAHATELGENIEEGVDGFTQVLWENPFLNLKEETDAKALLQTIANQVRNVSNTAYTITWRGCPAFELGDVLILQDKDNNANFVRYFNETLEYNGGLRATSEWEPGESENVEVAPTSISKTLKQTYAKVNKIDQEIILLAEKVENTDVGTLSEEIAELKVTTDAITAEVSKNSDDLEYVQTQLTSENLSVLVNTEVDSIKTSTGFTFDGSGLNISKDGSATTTNLNENGMIIYDLNQDAVLTVNNVGVSATNLQANTYLIIGDRSRFENYDDANGTARTGCFWLQ